MTRRQVASLFRVTSAAVASWARRGRLPEVRDEAGRPRYRRSDVETLFRERYEAEGAMTGAGKALDRGSNAMRDTWTAPGSARPAPGWRRTRRLARR